jgi:thiol peroxidase
MATVKFKDTVLSLLGNEVKVGQTAPDFKVQKSADMSDYTLASGAGKTRIIATVPSLDTPVCDIEAQIRATYAIALSRPPTDDEMRLALDFLKKQKLVDFAHVMLNLNEFVYMR